MTLYTAIASASRSLEVFQTAIEVAGQNISNANTPGYIREEVQLAPSGETRIGNLVMGTGVLAVGVKQQIDRFLEFRLQAANTEASEAEALNSVYKQLEAVVNELGDEDLSTTFTEFLDSLNVLVNEPESVANREIVLQTGERLATDITTLRARIDEIRVRQNVSVDGIVAQANPLIEEIHLLNGRISRLEASGGFTSDAGSLRSRRYQALAELAEAVPIDFRENPNGSIDVFTEDDYLVLGNSFQTFEIVTEIDRGVAVNSVELSLTRSDVSRHGGQLAGIVEGRDDVLGQFVDDLDSLASALIFEFNKIHSGGQGLQNFTSLSSAYAVDDTSAGLDTTTANLPFTPTHGGFAVRVVNQASGEISTTQIAVDLDGIGTDDSLDDLATKLDATTNLNATTTTDGRLSLTTADGYEFAFADDTSGVLAALGINTFFTGTDSGDVAVNSVVAADSRLIAAARGGGPSDGDNALELVRFHETRIDSLGGFGVQDFYENTITVLARESASTQTIADGRLDYHDSLAAQREQFSGVSIDEEALKILQFQRSYQAAARIISTVDELFDTLLSL